MSRPRLELTSVGKNTSHSKISPLDSTPVHTKTKDPKELTIPTELSETLRNSEKEYVLEDSESEPSISDTSFNESDFSDYSNYSKSKIK